MFLHGWGGGAVSFLSVARGLRGINSLLFDFRGFGNSRCDKVMTLEDYVRDVISLMDEIGIEKAVLVGHSFGCRVGALIAAYYPGRTVGLIFTDGAGLKPRRGIRYYFKVFSYKLKKRLGADVSDAGSPDYRELDGVMKRTFVNVVNRYTDKECKSIKHPVLVVWGRDDEDTPPYMAKRFCRLIRGSALVFLEGGHFCYLQNLAQYTAIVEKFVSGVWYGVDRRGA